MKLLLPIGIFITFAVSCGFALMKISLNYWRDMARSYKEGYEQEKRSLDGMTELAEACLSQWTELSIKHSELIEWAGKRLTVTPDEARRLTGKQ